MNAASAGPRCSAPKLTGALIPSVPRGVSLQMGDRELGLLGLGDDPRATLVEGAADLGQREAPRAAVEQPRAQPVLERRDRLADRRFRHAELGRRRGEALGSTTRANTAMPVSLSMPRPAA